MIKKGICFTGDIFRPEGCQNPNIDWLGKTFSKLVLSASNSYATVITHGEDFARDYYDLLNLDSTNYNHWARIYDGEARNLESDTLIINTFKDYRLVVGFEMPPVIKNILADSTIPYLDLRIHPLRYGSDTVLMGNTNCLVTQLLMHSLVRRPQTWFEEEVEKYKCRHSETNFFSEPSCLIAAQTQQDTTVIKDKRFYTLRDFAEKIHEVKSKYSKVYIKHHPQCIDTRLEEIYNDIEFLDTTVPIYQYFLDPNLKCVCSLSSSSSYEAQMFGIETEFWLQKNFEFGLDWIPLNYDTLEVGFWEVITGRKPLEDYSPSIVSYPEGYFKNSLLTGRTS